MATYVAFLRAINLGATRKFPKDAIRSAVEKAGFTDVETYINTGNVRFDCTLRSRAKVEATLEEAFLADRGFEVPTIVFTPEELTEIASDAARFADGHDGRHYVSLLKEVPTAAQVAAVEALGTTSEVARVGGRAVHLLLGANYHEARLTNAVIEKHLGVATNRNLTVLTALAEKWGAR
jgi:uncharacterized protein (DUF1697 family)